VDSRSGYEPVSKSAISEYDANGSELKTLFQQRSFTFFCFCGHAKQLCAMSLSIGADVGEINTTAIILKEKELLCSSEVLTTQDVTSGIIEAIDIVLRQLPEEHAHNRGENFEKVSIGTTQFENAVKQGKDLSKVALFRLCYPATVAIPPPYVPGLDKFFYLNGGCETDGTTITHVDEDQLTQKTREVYIEGRSNATGKSKNIIWA